MKTLTASETQTILIRNGLDERGKPGFAFRNPSAPVFYDWHDHPCHQITYAKCGTTQIEGPDGWHLLPTAHALWIPAETRHRTMIRNLDSVSVYFDPANFPTQWTSHIQTFPVPVMIREMLFHTLHWPAGSAEQSSIARSFFHTLGLLCVEQMQVKTEQIFTLPRATHPSIIRAMDAALTDPGRASLPLALELAGMSERSFRRHFHDETQMTWQQWITQARLFHAASLLAGGLRVTDVANESGYASLSAFAKAFTQQMGVSPTNYKKLQTEPCPLTT
ncbi:helix-turn-helix transcriptional regulator [Acetobacter suratthaniensis]|uniref:Helix-turn-helix domain-containing protein n=1 Tax=Acetobacter suratthaniensis TaxID=1502841 RepID=A0ABS3LLL7_9PROT|nr:helix-turn-helix transcriptional regulator [Acetobacter suratthaniensis]MBO1328263.1 helix-turn-helix domain-containing protein [Acetobacter suratthaniensis]MCX2566385.1 helix-turn-helix transcriptional regulator [Acetobacter suratthaniensis]